MAVYELTVPSKPMSSWIAGSDVFCGTVLATRAVGFDSLVAEPRLFVAVTSTRRVEPTSPGTGT